MNVLQRKKHTEDDCKELQKNIDKLRKWATTWGIQFQPVKCNMTLSRTKKNITFNYILKNTILELTSIKYLGVHISNDLHWGKHMTKTCNKAYRTHGLLQRNVSSCFPRSEITTIQSVCEKFLPRKNI